MTARAAEGPVHRSSMTVRSVEDSSAQTVVRVVATASATLLVLYAVYLVRHVVALVRVAAFLAVGLDPAVRRL